MFWQLDFQDYLYKWGRRHRFAIGHCFLSFVVKKGTPDLRALGYHTLIYAKIYTNCSIVFTWWSTLYPLAHTPRKFLQSVFFVFGFYKQDFVGRNLSGNRGFFVSWYSFCWIHHLCLVHLWKKREVAGSQVRRCTRGVSSFTPPKEIDVVLTGETGRLLVDKQVGHTIVCERAPRGSHWPCSSHIIMG